MFSSTSSQILYHFHRFPALTIQQATNEPEDSIIAQEAISRGVFENGANSMMKHMNRSTEVDPCYMTISNLHDVATSLVISGDGRRMACGSADGVVRLYDMQTGRELKTYTGHSDAITCVCFVGNGKLCSTSADNNVSLWDVEGGFRWVENYLFYSSAPSVIILILAAFHEKTAVTYNLQSAFQE
jgi:WD40 repeat protein